MRTSYILPAVVVLLAACSNDAETTAPHLPAAATSNAQSYAPIANPPSAKPVPGPVVVTVASPIYTLDGFIQPSMSAFATCPTGSVVVGGGHVMHTGFGTAWVSRSKPAGATVYEVEVVVSGSTSSKFQAFAQCLLQ